MNEFELIAHFFKPTSHHHLSNRLGVGDDAAIIDVPNNQQLVTSIDTLVSGVHFPTDTQPYDIGFKSIAVNLSDMAAMGAIPTAILLSITLPNNDPIWIERFAKGVFTLLDRYQVDLMGGDLSRGPLSITATAMGYVDNNTAIRRQGAAPGDTLYVSGTLGGAAYALNNNTALDALNRPQPRVMLGQALSGIASAAIDISDGIAADIQKLTHASHVGATIHLNQLPLSPLLASCTQKQIQTYVLCGGDDYELCFTVPKTKQAILTQLKDQVDCPFQAIGTITDTKIVEILDQTGKPVIIQHSGFDHFRSDGE
jgi:thiamine-monophosphate kinase